MSVLKGIFVYTLIFLGLVLGVGVILIGVMYFFPQVSVFGYQFYHGNNSGKIYEVLPDDSEYNEGQVLARNQEILNNLDAIEIKADKWNINVVYNESSLTNRFRVEFTRSITGFVSTKTPKPQFSVTASQKTLVGQSEVKNVVTFKVEEPKGAYFNRSATLTVWIPSNIANGNLDDLRIESGSGSVNFAQKSLGELIPVGNPILNVKELYLVDESNEMNVAHTNILNTLNIQSKESKFTIDRDLTCDVNLDVKKGKYQFKNIVADSITPEIVVDAVNADVIFGNVEGNLILKTDFGFFRADTVDGSFSSLSHNISDYNNACDIKIKKILGTTIIQNDSGKIELGQVGEIESTTSITDLKIDTKSGDVTINNCFAKIAEITSKSGVIRLNNCLSNINATTTYGSVYVHYMKEDAVIDGVESTTIKNAVSNLKNVTTKIITGNGKGNGAIEVYDSMGTLDLNSKGSGKVVAHMKNVIGANNISSKGNVSIVVPEDSKFWATWQANKSADIHVVTFESKEKKINSTMTNYDATKFDNQGGVFLGGNRDGSNTITMAIKAGNNLKFLSTYHYEIG